MQSLAFARFGADGIIWHTKRLSWDGFRDVQIENNRLIGYGWSIESREDRWCLFHVDLATGSSTGGGFGDKDLEGWEKLAH